jgi:hypothetical protein
MYVWQIDRAVTPLFHMFKEQPSSLDQLDSVCNQGKLFNKIQKQNIFSVEAVRQLVQSLPASSYVVPKEDLKLRKMVLDGIRDNLNGIFDEFVPDFSVDNAFKYIQVISHVQKMSACMPLMPMKFGR